MEREWFELEDGLEFFCIDFDVLGGEDFGCVFVFFVWFVGVIGVFGGGGGFNLGSVIFKFL